MYEPGELIFYGSEGVCRVEAVGHPDIGGINHEKLCYTLSPIYRTGQIYIPVDTTVFMRPILTHAEADALIRKIPEVETEYYHNRNLRRDKLDRMQTKYKILAKETLHDGSILIEIKKQYNTSPVGDYLDT